MFINPEIAGRIQGGRFVPGVSGNPAGKPPGARARATRLAEKLMAGDAEAKEHCGHVPRAGPADGATIQGANDDE